MNDLVRLKKKQYELMQAKLKLLEENKLWKFKPYPWQADFWAAGRKNKQRLLMAANQVGKTSCCAIEVCYHVTGIYPENWQGYKFNHPINCWCLGVSGEQIKRVLQNKILGKEGKDDFSDGLIPNKYIDIKSAVRGQLKGSIKEIKIKYKDVGWSKLSFLSYEQGQHVLMGDVVDLALIDEEPRDNNIYGQVVTRTINGNHGDGGLVILGFTPENGTTELVYQFTDKIQEGQYLQTATWEDAPHLSEEKKEQILAALPPHQREMRSKGIPQLGSGAVYPIMDDQLYSDLDSIPDYFKRLNAIDFGFRTCALIRGAWDVDNDILYIYDAEKIQEKTPAELSLIMNRDKWIPWAFPVDGHQPDKGKGCDQKELYTDYGVNMLDDPAATEEGSRSVELGILRLTERMKTGRLKVSKHLKQFWEEKRLYHRKDGKIVKKNDHIMDALRYLEISLRYAITKSDITGIKLIPRYKK